MFKKTIFSIILIHFCFLLQAQKAFDFNRDDMKSILKTETTKVLLTGDNDFDTKLKSAFNNYWNVSKFEFISADQYSKMKVGEDYKALFNYGEYKLSGYNSSFSKFSIYVNVKNNTTYGMLDLCFDNMTNTKTNEVIGADKTKEALLNKIAPYVMFMNSQLKKQIELGNANYSKYSGNKELIKDRKIFIQEEYFLNNFDPNLLSKLNFKVEILNSKQINSIVENKNEREKYGWLCFTTSPREISAFIIDLKTGELLNYASIYKADTPNKTLNEKILTKLIKQLSEE